MQILSDNLENDEEFPEIASSSQYKTKQTTRDTSCKKILKHPLTIIVITEH